MITHLRELSRLAHSSLRGWDREHVLQLLAAVGHDSFLDTHPGKRPLPRHTPRFLDTPFPGHDPFLDTPCLDPFLDTHPAS